MTTIGELCQRLVWIAKDRPLSRWPEESQRRQFLFLVDTRLDPRVARKEMLALASHFAQLAQAEHPSREVQRLAHEQMLADARWRAEPPPPPPDGYDAEG